MLGFLCACLLVASYLGTGCALCVLIDGIGPSSDLWNPETLGFNGILIGTVMMPEHFGLLPHLSAPSANDIPTNRFPFNMRLSPIGIALCTASLLGVAQATLVYTLWRTVSVSTGFGVRNVTCGILTFAIVVLVFALIVGVAKNANALQHLKALDQRENEIKAQHKNRRKASRTKR